MTLQESGEMYLETILILSKRLGKVRSIDVSDYMNFSKPSVSRAIGLLKGENYILVGEDGGITLTKSGKEIAEKIYERHTVLTDILKKIGVPEEVAMTDACKIEHDISDATFIKIKELLK